MHLVSLTVYSLASLAAVSALAVEKPALSAREDYGHFATYVFPESGLSYDFLVRGYSGDISTITLDASSGRDFGLATRFRSLGNGSAPGGALQERDTCAAIASCFEYAADATGTAVTFITKTTGSVCASIGSSVYNYFTANSYANLNSILQGSVVGFAINLGSTAFGNAYLNGEAGLDSPDGNNLCNAADPNNLANNYADAIFTFCQSIQTAQSANTDTHFAAGEFNDAKSEIDGAQALLKAFVAAQAGNFGPVCASLGVTWKRAISTHLRRLFLSSE